MNRLDRTSFIYKTKQSCNTEFINSCIKGPTPFMHEFMHVGPSLECCFQAPLINIINISMLARVYRLQVKNVMRMETVFKSCIKMLLSL